MFGVPQSEAEPAARWLFTAAVRNDLCGILANDKRLLYARASLIVHLQRITYVGLEKHSISFPIFPAAKPVSKEVLLHARWRSSLTSQSQLGSTLLLLFPPPHSPSAPFPSARPCDIYLRLSAIMETTAW